MHLVDVNLQSELLTVTGYTQTKLYSNFLHDIEIVIKNNNGFIVYPF